jgi:ParB-like chromosome segregation protein Spo0J
MGKPRAAVKPAAAAAASAPIAPAAAAAENVAVDLRRADELVPYARNARRHSDAHVAEIAASIAEFGWTNPILHDEVIRAGHARHKAALLIYKQGRRIKLPSGKELPDGMVPVIDCSGWSEAQKRAYVLADNKLNEGSDWDEELLRLEVGDLDGLGFDLSIAGFGDAELKRLLGDDAGGAGNGGGELQPQYQILIECESEAKQIEILEKLNGDGIACRALVA